jgi:endonuclease III
MLYPAHSNKCRFCWALWQEISELLAVMIRQDTTEENTINQQPTFLYQLPNSEKLCDISKNNIHKDVKSEGLQEYHSKPFLLV